MPVRSIGTATISFGLVSVPVHVYSTGESAASVSFNMVHKDCGTKLKQYYKCPKHDVTVERADTVKGYEFAKGQFVIFTPEELKALEEKGDGSILINEFIPLAQVDRIYLEKAYYLGPDKGGDRPYKLLAEALKKSGRAGLGQYAARGHQNLVLVRPTKDGVLVMEQLHYADELRPGSEVPLGEGEVKPAELNLAMQIVEQGATEEFKPETYKDTVRIKVQEAINQKVEGHEITGEPQEEKGTKVLDLMEALKASLAKGKAAEKKEKEAPAKAERPKKKAAGGR
ncbi:MAG TPA: Ku protein [Gemmatimonadales bacterium]|jgi:DNA end-binding protein Ku|nr:Ku protein [Gemmatimonadales bacterium]